MESAPLLGKGGWRPIAWCIGVPVRYVDGEMRALSDVQGRYACRMPRGYCLWGDPSKHMRGCGGAAGVLTLDYGSAYTFTEVLAGADIGDGVHGQGVYGSRGS